MNAVLGAWYGYCVVDDLKQLTLNATDRSKERDEVIKKIVLSSVKAVASVTWGMMFAGRISIISCSPKVQQICWGAFFLFYGEMFCRWTEAVQEKHPLPLLSLLQADTVPRGEQLHVMGYGVLFLWATLALFDLYFSSIFLSFFLQGIWYAGMGILVLGKIQL